VPTTPFHFPYLILTWPWKVGRIGVFTELIVQMRRWVWRELMMYSWLAGGRWQVAGWNSDGDSCWCSLNPGTGKKTCWVWGTCHSEGRCYFEVMGTAGPVPLGSFSLVWVPARLECYLGRVPICLVHCYILVPSTVHGASEARNWDKPVSAPFRVLEFTGVGGETRAAGQGLSP
jgi:hypothetical protein